MPSSFDCKNKNPKYVYRPVYFQCWGLGALPSAISIDIGPMAKNPNWQGDDLCNNYTVVGGAMNRIPCTYAYAFTGDIGVVLTTGSFDYDSNTPTEIPISDTIDQNPLLTDPSGTPRWYVGGSGTLKPGATSWCNRVNDVTTMEISGIFETELCIGPIRIYYQGL